MVFKGSEYFVKLLETKIMFIFRLTSRQWKTLIRLPTFTHTHTPRDRERVREREREREKEREREREG